LNRWDFILIYLAPRFGSTLKMLDNDGLIIIRDDLNCLKHKDMIYVI